MRSLYPVSLFALAIAAPLSAQDAGGTAQAETPAAADDADADESEIVVTATRLPGQVVTDSPPVLELEEADIAAYGATSIEDLVAQLSPQVGSGRGRGGRPVILVNGQRITSFREIRRFPPEAIRKVEVLPEEVALKFGYAADARVINFILKDAFASTEVEVEFSAPTRGGTATAEAEASLLTITGPRRTSANLEYTRTSPLTEGDRGVVQAAGSSPTLATDPDPADYRSLVARSETVEANATLTTGLGELGSGKQLTLNGNVSRNVRTALSGLDTVVLTDPSGAQALRTLDADPITRKTATDTYSLGAGYNMPLGDWQLSSTLDASRTDTDSRIDRRRDTGGLVAAAAAGTLALDGALPATAGGGFDQSLSRVWSASQKNTLAGTPVRLPGGEVNVTLDAGYDWTRIESSDTRSGLAPTQLTRGNLNAGFNVGVPIASTREGVLDAIGDLSLNFGGGIDHLSDFGTLTDWNVGANWRPAEKLALQGSYTVRKVAPGLSQLGGPTIIDVNVPVFDFSTGQTVLATVTSGGNPGLREETQRDLKLSASYDLDWFDRANIRVEYFRNQSDDTTEGFPLLTPAIEAAFPGRVARAADGTLLSIDRRPVTFAERNSSRIRYGINLFGKVGKPKPETEDSGGAGRGGFRGAMAAAEPAPPAAGAGGSFDPARFAQMRTQFCASPADAAPDLSGLPERMAERLKGPDGQIDPAKVAEARTRMCNADGTPRADAGGRTFDPARFAALRTALNCGADGQPVDPAALPPEIADRLKGPDGTIDPARLAELRTRLCALPADGSGGSGRRGGQPGGQRGPDGERGAGAGGRGGSGGGRGAGGSPFGGGGDGQGRWNLSLYHTVELTNRALIADGGPELDLLQGDGLTDGGVSRHRIELEGGVFKDGLGARVSANYQSGTTVRGSGLPGSSDLRFGELATVNLNLFANLEQQDWLTGGGEPGFWKGTRLSLRVRNLFDAQQRVTDADGIVPLRYQPALIDPTGRTVGIEFRKMF
ncbi:hypothetical protein [Altererythrobacter sp. TH136]|uniref:TonB-dependent receptor plug domain-containing protein n=1 Tax=Altererythrobacter sp. TH136 TaxID=2067415 RepID=UPI001162081D|nr:hypothetical protein [Altererythrobacter sp. TH136]QDM40580.1 hypothetical protein C0V74_05640 [Altererythrobacter sp. TH136]